MRLGEFEEQSLQPEEKYLRCRSWKVVLLSMHAFVQAFEMVSMESIESDTVASECRLGSNGGAYDFELGFGGEDGWRDVIQ